MPHCQTFKQKIEELKKRIQSLGALSIEELLLKYRNTGDEKIAEELYRILQEIEEFKKEYEEKVKELLIEWYPKKDKINEFLQNLKINERGRVEIEELDLSFCNLSGTLYLLSLFEKIEVLNCSNNQLTSLPELPDGLEMLDCAFNQFISLPELPGGLKELYCSFNHFTSLPELPDGLKVLDCSFNQLTSLPELPNGLKLLFCFNNRLTSLPELPKSLIIIHSQNNQLSQETIEKIKSHPNYDSSTWII
jgi:Leucine-rich repeat (LRR) protein